MRMRLTSHHSAGAIHGHRPQAQSMGTTTACAIRGAQELGDVLLEGCTWNSWNRAHGTMPMDAFRVKPLKICWRTSAGNAEGTYAGTSAGTSACITVVSAAGTATGTTSAITTCDVCCEIHGCVKEVNHGIVICGPVGARAEFVLVCKCQKEANRTDQIRPY